MEEEIKVPKLGIDNKPKEKHKTKKKKRKDQEFTFPDQNTGSFISWERYPIGRNAEKKPSRKKVVKDYLESKMAEFPENKSYPFLADLKLAD